jgi:5'-nucleotidase
VYEDDGTTLIGYAVEGRPADCVKLALLELLPEPPDLIVSGMNAGSNAGINVLYSGTVAAAIEGAFYKHTAIAVSLEYDKKIYDFAAGARHARRVIDQIVAHNPRPGSLFNVNIPVLERGPVRGVKVLPQNVSPYLEKFDRRVNPRGAHVLLGQPRVHVPGAAPGHRRGRPARELHHRHPPPVRPDRPRPDAGASEVGVEGRVNWPSLGPRPSRPLVC